MDRGKRGPYKKVPVDMDEVYIDMTQTKEQKVKAYLNQVKDPYQVRIDGVLVEMEFAENGPSMEELLELAISID